MKPTIEEVKRFWDDRPCNVRHSSKISGTLEYFEEIHKKRYFVEPHILRFANFPEWKGKKVLEIGCGIGTDAVSFAKSGAHYTGVELSETSLDLAKKQFQVYDIYGKFYLGNAEELCSFLPEKKYDLIYSFGVIHHSPIPENIFSGIEKYLVDGGVLKVMLYAKYSWKNYMIEVGLDQPEAQFGVPIANTYTKNEIITMMKGYDIRKIEQAHIFPYLIEPYKKGEYIKQPWISCMPPEMFKVFEKKLGWHLLITAMKKA